MAGKNISQRLEIVYQFHPTPGWRREHWMYVEVSGKTVEEFFEKGRKYFQKQMRELGWTRITTLTSVGPLKRVTDASPKKTVAPESKPAPRKSRSSNTKRGKGNATGDTRKTRTSKRKVKKSSGGS